MSKSHATVLSLGWALPSLAGLILAAEYPFNTELAAASTGTPKKTNIVNTYTQRFKIIEKKHNTQHICRLQLKRGLLWYRHHPKSTKLCQIGVHGLIFYQSQLNFNARFLNSQKNGK